MKLHPIPRCMLVRFTKCMLHDNGYIVPVTFSPLIQNLKIYEISQFSAGPSGHTGVRNRSLEHSTTYAM